ncbi:hypothetical protein GP486_005791 [Trichoglossum hirsutum]|uniref:Uncharacterized protein n=1 Tax=Trichoglossum hirsutum TaxID=265104 RepID=A0A9P8RLZ4_9PEZI|nr:hypothetical protein GP486_005791 [Trichoglossum hirsutum]
MPLGSRSSNVKKLAGGGKARNGSILNFFKKVSPPRDGGNGDDGGGLFFKDDSEVGGDGFTLDYSPVDDLFEDPEPSGRYNESVGSAKRRKLGSTTAETETSRGEGLFCSPVKGEQSIAEYPKRTYSPPPSPPPPPLDRGELGVGVEGSRSGSSELVYRAAKEKPKRVVGPFVEDTDSEEETEPVIIKPIRDSTRLGSVLKQPDFKAADSGALVEKLGKIWTQKPGLGQDEADVPEDEEFADIEDYDDDVSVGGEDVAERRWMGEQRRLELAQDGVDPDFIDDPPEGDDKMLDLEVIAGEDSEKVAVCPICNVSLEDAKNGISNVPFRMSHYM